MSQCLIKVEEVGKFFRTVRAVDGLSFSVNSGEIFALLGPNGAGKSTMVRMVIGLIPPDHGTIQWYNENGMVERIDARQIGYLPEDRGLYRDQKVQAILEYFGQLRGLTSRDARLAAIRWAERLEVSQYLDAKLETLSKGNQQKVQVAASILHQPKLAILDEPFSGLDPVNQEKMLDVIRLLRDEGSTVLLSAHQLQLVERLADRVLLLSQGRRVISGTVSELKSSEFGGYALAVTFARPISREAVLVWRDDPTIEQLEILHDRAIKLTLKNAHDAAAWLNRAAGLGEITEFTGGTLSLHEIYVRAISGQVGQSNIPTNRLQSSASVELQNVQAH